MNSRGWIISGALLLGSALSSVFTVDQSWSRIQYFLAAWSQNFPAGWYQNLPSVWSQHYPAGFDGIFLLGVYWLFHGIKMYRAEK